jgi:hypothetical protein
MTARPTLSQVELLRTAGAVNTVPKSNGAGGLAMSLVGDVTGPASSTDERVARFDLATGKLLQQSNVRIDDTGNMAPASNDACKLGSATLRWSEVRARIILGVTISGSGTVSIPASAQGGGLFGAVNCTALATAELVFGVGSPFPPIILGGNALASGTSVARMTNSGGGSSMFGSAFSIVGTALVRNSANSYGSFTGGYAVQGTLAGTTVVSNYASGSFVWGYGYGNSVGTAKIGAAATAGGAFVSGRVGGGAHLLQGASPGGFTQGYCSGVTASIIETTNTGSGSFAQGAASGGGIIRAAGSGAFAQGFAPVNSIIATGAGALAIGNATAGNIAATGVNAQQFGPGTNSEANSLKVGTAGLRFKGTAGAPGTPVVGDMWVDAGGFITVRTPTGVNLSLNRPTVTGSRGGNAALASLLTQLATMGLIVDSSS